MYLRPVEVLHYLHSRTEKKLKSICSSIFCIDPKLHTQCILSFEKEFLGLHVTSLCLHWQFPNVFWEIGQKNVPEFMQNCRQLLKNFIFCHSIEGGKSILCICLLLWNQGFREIFKASGHFQPRNSINSPKLRVAEET